MTIPFMQVKKSRHAKVVHHPVYCIITLYVHSALFYCFTIEENFDTFEQSGIKHTEGQSGKF